MVIRWRPPQAGWYKVNFDVSATSSPGHLYSESVFRNARGFFVAAVANNAVWGYPFEAELAAILHAILFAFEKG
ncbi:hypothetical protein ACS0TY_029936 [Phlomoides rotata]